MRMVIRSTGNVQVRKVYLTQFCDMKSIVALYCSSHSTRLDRWLSWWYPVYILLNLIHCFWTRTTQRVFPFNFYLCNCTYFHVQYPPCRKLWNCGKAPEFELWPALILKEESTKEEEDMAVMAKMCLKIGHFFVIFFLDFLGLRAHISPKGPQNIFFKNP